MAFIATLAIVVLSSSAAAIDGYYDDYDDGYDADYVAQIGENITALILILIIAVILYGVFNWVAEKTEHHYVMDTDTNNRICLTTDEMYELNVYTDSYEYKQTSNKDMALNYKIDRMVANRSHEDTKCLTTDEIAEKTGHPYIPDTDTSDQTDEWDYDDEIDDGWTYDNERNIWIEDEWVEDE